MCNLSSNRFSLETFASLTIVALNYKGPPQFECGEAIYLWNNQYTFSYHETVTGAYMVDYSNTLRSYLSKLEAEIAMANLVYEFNGGK